MITTLTKENLIAFEDKVAKKFNSKKIRAPIHLYSGNEEQIIKVFQNINKDDWVLCSWRSHYQCLLKGVPENILMKAILNGRSISLCFPEQKIFSSAIVGGVLSIAVGIALSIKKKKDNNLVYCFMGDMTSETGIAHESIKYCMNHDLPIRFVIEDNELSVCTNTKKVWAMKKLTYENIKHPMIIYYKYKNKYPHAGAGERVQF